MSKEIEILYLAEKDVALTGLTMKETVETIERVFKAHGEGDVIVPSKISLDMKITAKYDTWGNAMPAYVGPWNMSGIKWAGANWNNPKKYGLPSIFATIILTDPETFAPVAIIGGGWITAMRTGAATAVAAKYLARHDAKVLCIVGAGYQSGFQLSALNEVQKLSEVRVADIRKNARESFAEEMGKKLSLNVSPVDSMENGVKGADIIVTVTSADAPLVRNEWLKTGCFICAVGSYQELDFKIIRTVNKIVVDHLEQTMHRGELAKWVSKGLISKRDVYAELGYIVAGKKKGRESDTERILCVPIGMGSEDIAISKRIYEISLKKGLGKKLRWL
ncbi:MAG: ornithine cyclodeaminase [Candidatus Bathyarchaeota archaeon]|nr:MAG: ornithine cyclodeaminase [Candidatus Bathyarchaeota archaeon]